MFQKQRHMWKVMTHNDIALSQVQIWRIKHKQYWLIGEEGNCACSLCDKCNLMNIYHALQHAAACIDDKFALQHCLWGAFWRPLLRCCWGCFSSSWLSFSMCYYKHFHLSFWQLLHLPACCSPHGVVVLLSLDSLLLLIQDLHYNLSYEHYLCAWCTVCKPFMQCLSFKFALQSCQVEADLCSQNSQLHNTATGS